MPRLEDGTGIVWEVPGYGIIQVAGPMSIMPPDGGLGFAHGCLFHVLDSAGSDNGLYTNVGTVSSANFDAIEVTGGSTDAETLAGVTPGAFGLTVLALADDANLSVVGGSFTGLSGLSLAADDAYDATNWDGSLAVPTKNAIRDKFEALLGGGASLDALPDNQAVGFAASSSGFLRTSQTDTETLAIQARDVDGAAWVSFITLTAGNDPTCVIGSAPTAKLAFYGATAVAQQAFISDPAGGGTQDAEARTAIAAIIDRLISFGLIASS
jgi:hypothetical protein